MAGTRVKLGGQTLLEDRAGFLADTAICSQETQVKREKGTHETVTADSWLRSCFCNGYCVDEEVVFPLLL